MQGEVTTLITELGWAYAIYFSLLYCSKWWPGTSIPTKRSVCWGSDNMETTQSVVADLREYAGEYEKQNGDSWASATGEDTDVPRHASVDGSEDEKVFRNVSTILLTIKGEDWGWWWECIWDTDGVNSHHTSSAYASAFGCRENLNFEVNTMEYWAFVILPKTETWNQIRN